MWKNAHPQQRLPLRGGVGQLQRLRRQREGLLDQHLLSAHKDLSDLDGEMSGMGVSASEAHVEQRLRDARDDEDNNPADRSGRALVLRAAATEREKERERERKRARETEKESETARRFPLT